VHQNLRWWLPYRFLTGLHFWYPIFFLYFLARLPLVQVLQLEAIYYASVVLLEVPSGWFSDRIGRRPTLLISKAAHVVSALLFAASGEGDFVLLATAQLFLAAGFAFTSGTDAAFLHDTLQSSAGDRYERLEARSSRLGFLASAGAAALGGVCWVVEPRLAYILTAISSLAAFVLLLKMVEPPRSERAAAPWKQLRRCLHDMRDAAVWRLVAWWAGMIVLWHIPWEYLQPALKDLSGDAFVGITAGVHWTFAMLLAAWAAGMGPWLRSRFGLSGTLLFSTLFVTILNASMWLAVQHQIMTVVAVALALGRSMPRAAANAPHRAALLSRIGEDRKATMLSLQSLLGRGLFSLTLLLLSVWPDRQDQLAVATGLSLVFLLLAVRFLGRASHITRVGAGRGKTLPQ
jgi:MFS family permease